MVKRQMIWALLLSIMLVGCSAHQTVVPNPKKDRADIQVPEKNTSSAPSASNSNQALPKSSSPVIVQSAPEPVNNDEVLDDISRELDNLTNILNGMEEPDTTWDEEVDQP